MLRSKKRSVWKSFFKGLLLLIIAGTATGYFLSQKPEIASRWISYLPFPKKLVSVRFLHNGEEITLEPGARLSVKAGDSLQLLDFRTDGWISMGVRLTSSDLDVGALKKPVVLKTLWPIESLEVPKPVRIQAHCWNKPIGEVSFSVRLGAKDWIALASGASDADRKIRYFQNALEEDPQNTLIKTQLANLYLDTQQYDKSVRLYQEILQLGKSKPILHHLLSAYKLQDQVDQALMVYMDILQISASREDFEEFLKYFQEHKTKEELMPFIKGQEKSIPEAFYKSLLLVLADWNVREKDWSGAAAAYEEVIRAGVKDSNILYNLAVAYEQGGDSDQAVQTMSRYLEKNPDDVQSLIKLGALQEKKGDLKQARKIYESILEKNPENQEALVRLLALLQKTGEKQALSEGYERLAKLRPQDKVVHSNLAVLYYEQKNWEKALSAFKTLAALDPKDIESRKYLLDIYEKKKDVKGQEETLQSLIRLEPNTLGYYKALFSLYDKSKDYKTIVSLFQKATERFPNSVVLRQYVLYGLLKLGNKEKALAELEHLIRIKPKEKKYLQQAVQLYEEQKNYEQALKKLQELLKINPRDQEAQDNYLRLKRLSLKAS